MADAKQSIYNGKIKIVPSIAKGDLDEYSLADFMNASSIKSKLIGDLEQEGKYSSDLVYRIFTAHRSQIMFDTGTDRDTNSSHWDTDPTIAAEDKIFLDKESSLIDILAKLGMKYMCHGGLCIAVYKSLEAFSIIDGRRILAVFKEKDPNERLKNLLSVYIVNFKD